MKTFLCFCLTAILILSGCSKPAGDLGVNPNENQLKSATPDKAVSHRFPSDYYIQLTCDGVNGDFLIGSVDTHCVMFGHPGAWQWMIMTFSGKLTNEITGEEFVIKETDKYDNLQNVFTFHANVRGDKGNHYILSGSGLLVPPWTLTIDKVTCPGSN
jgi:hypothetical protein